MTLRDEIKRIVDHELGSIEVDARGSCRWTDVANAQTHIDAQIAALSPQGDGWREIVERCARTVEELWPGDFSTPAIRARQQAAAAIRALPSPPHASAQEGK